MAAEYLYTWLLTGVIIFGIAVLIGAFIETGMRDR